MLFAFGDLLHVARILTLGHGFYLASFFMALLSGISMIAACAVRSSKPHTGSGELWRKDFRCRRFVYGIYSFVVVYSANMIAAYAVWSIFYALVNLAFVLVAFSSVAASPEDAGTGCLSAFLILLVVHAALDLTVLDRFTRFHFTPYIFEVLAMATVLDYRNVAGSRNSVLTIVTMYFYAFLFIKGKYFLGISFQ